MQEYIPIDEESTSLNQDLKEAYKLVLDALDANLGLEHWKAVLEGRSKLGHFLNPGPNAASDPDSDSDSDSDSNLKLAIATSLVDQGDKKTSFFEMPQPVPRPCSVSDSDSEANLNLQSPRKRSTPPSQFTLAKRQRTLPPHGQASQFGDIRRHFQSTPLPNFDLSSASRSRQSTGDKGTVIRAYSDNDIASEEKETSTSASRIGDKADRVPTNFLKQSHLNDESFVKATRAHGNNIGVLAISTKNSGEMKQYADAEMYVLCFHLEAID